MIEVTTTQPTPISATNRDEQSSDAKSHRVTAVAWLAGITAVVALGTVKPGVFVGC